jgi:hypothetical protein
MRNFQVGGRVPIKPFENLLKIIKLKYRKVGIDEGHAQIAPDERIFVRFHLLVLVCSFSSISENSNEIKILEKIKDLWASVCGRKIYGKIYINGKFHLSHFLISFLLSSGVDMWAIMVALVR